MLICVAIPYNIISHGCHGTQTSYRQQKGCLTCSSWETLEGSRNYPRWPNRLAKRSYPLLTHDRLQSTNFHCTAKCRPWTCSHSWQARITKLYRSCALHAFTLWSCNVRVHSWTRLMDANPVVWTILFKYWLGRTKGPLELFFWRAAVLIHLLPSRSIQITLPQYGMYVWGVLNERSKGLAMRLWTMLWTKLPISAVLRTNGFTDPPCGCGQCFGCS